MIQSIFSLLVPVLLILGMVYILLKTELEAEDKKI